MHATYHKFKYDHLWTAQSVMNWFVHVLTLSISKEKTLMKKIARKCYRNLN